MLPDRFSRTTAQIAADSPDLQPTRRDPGSSRRRRLRARPDGKRRRHASSGIGDRLVAEEPGLRHAEQTSGLLGQFLAGLGDSPRSSLEVLLQLGRLLVAKEPALKPGGECCCRLAGGCRAENVAAGVQELVSEPDCLLVPRASRLRPGRAERRIVDGEPVMQLQRIGGLADAQRDVHAFNDAGPESHLQARGLGTHHHRH